MGRLFNRKQLGYVRMAPFDIMNTDYDTDSQKLQERPDGGAFIVTDFLQMLCHIYLTILTYLVCTALHRQHLYDL